MQLFRCLQPRLAPGSAALTIPPCWPGLLPKKQIPKLLLAWAVLAKAASLALGALNRQLDKMSGQHNLRLWTAEALMSAEEWSTVRRWATKSLTELSEIPLSPSELLRRPRTFVLPTSRDAAAYGLVLRHTVEVGHGWGKQPSPLRGFYVLNRAIPDVEDPSLDQEVFENQGIGTPFNTELKQLLASSVADVAAIDFVPRFLELVDLKSSQPVWVRNNRGFVAMSPIRESERLAVVGVYFYAGGRWSRSNRYELIERDGYWGITKFQNLMIS